MFKRNEEVTIYSTILIIFRLKKKGHYKKFKEKTPPEQEEMTAAWDDL